MAEVGPWRLGWSIDLWGASVLRLSDHFRPALRTHFARLSDDDLYLRFGRHCTSEILDAYVDGIDFVESIVLGVFDDDLELIGAAHLSEQQGSWELGLSVLSSWRRRGVGGALLRRAMQRARLANADSIKMHCLSVNHALMRLVSKVGAQVVVDGSESDGTIALPAMLPLGGWGELLEQQWAAVNFAAKAELLRLRRLVLPFCGVS